MDVDHFTIEEKYQFWKWKNISWLISYEFFNEWLTYFIILFPIYLTFQKWHKLKKIEYWTWITLPLSHSINTQQTDLRVLIMTTLFNYSWFHERSKKMPVAGSAKSLWGHQKINWNQLNVKLLYKACRHHVGKLRWLVYAHDILFFYLFYFGPLPTIVFFTFCFGAITKMMIGIYQVGWSWLFVVHFPGSPM